MARIEYKNNMNRISISYNMKKIYKHTIDFQNKLVLETIKFRNTEEFNEQYIKNLLLSVNYYNLPYFGDEEGVEKVDFIIIGENIVYLIYCDLEYIVTHEYLPFNSENYILYFIVISNRKNISYAKIQVHSYVFWNIPLSGLFVFCPSWMQICNYQYLLYNDIKCYGKEFYSLLLTTDKYQVLSNDNHIYDYGCIVTNIYNHELDILKMAIKKDINLYYYCIGVSKYARNISSEIYNEEIMKHSIFNKYLYDTYGEEVYKQCLVYLSNNCVSTAIILYGSNFPLQLKSKLKSLLKNGSTFISID